MIAVVWLALLGCPKRVDDAPSMAHWLREADAAWDARGEAGYDPVDAALAQGWGLDPSDPGLRWRLVRLSVARGLAVGWDEAALTPFATGRAQGLEGLRLPASFQIPSEGVDPFARTTDEQAACLAWTSFAWARWWVLFGPEAAALDAPRIRALADEAADRGADPGLIAWSRALVDAGSGDLESATREFHTAIEAAPDDPWRRVDYVVLVARPNEDAAEVAAQRAAITAIVPKTPEDLRALADVDAAP